jgi:hypothetical protein
MELTTAKFILRSAAALVVCIVAIATPGCKSAKPTVDQTVERSTQKLSEAVSHDVADAARRDQMLKLVDQLEAVQKSFSKDSSDFVVKYRTLNADYDSPRTAYEQLFSEFNVQRVQARDRALDLHFQLASLATEKEWDHIGKVEVMTYEAEGKALAKEGVVP